MNSYQYDISLRVRHPSLDPAEITSALGLNPSRSWRAGEARTTPKGNPLEGRYSDSYWVVKLGEGRWPDRTLAAIINELLGQLASHQGFFHGISVEGGTVEFFICCRFGGIRWGGLDRDDHDCVYVLYIYM